MSTLTCALAQLDFPVGAIEQNTERAISALVAAREAGADLLLFPELALTGYPPEDLLLRPGFIDRCEESMERLAAQVTGIDVIMGHPHEENGALYNAVTWIREGRILGRYSKQCLPNYAVFDEQRYFRAGTEPLVVTIKGHSVAVIICEDCWERPPAIQAAHSGASLLLVPNASPYRRDKLDARKATLSQRHAEAGLPIAYLNLVGGQDELVFDGRSMLSDRDGRIVGVGPHCKEEILLVEFDGETLKPVNWPEYVPDDNQDVYAALVLGLKDYIHKNGFTDVVLGLSGGIDSALTMAIAVDALGAEHVHSVMMPSRHTSDLSLELAQQQSEWMGVNHLTLSVEPGFTGLLDTLEPAFTGTKPDLTEENLQARVRAALLMALSNKFGWMVLTTGNKSELAVGYCTIYGDMAGGFAPIKDCPKTLVYELARWRNQRSRVIPEAVITRPPSAELAPDQKDSDSLPPYDVLDAIIDLYVDGDDSVGNIIARGFDEAVVKRVARLIRINEYKRRQAAPGVRISNKAFGRDRRYPITSGWRDEKDGYQS